MEVNESFDVRLRVNSLVGFSRWGQKTRELWHSPVRRMLCLKWALCVALLSGMAFCPRVWGTDRTFPTVPVVDWLPDLPQAGCLVLLFLLIVSVLVVAIHPAPKLLTLLPAVLGFGLILFDINRLQPWMYQYLLMFMALAIVDWREPGSRRSLAAWGMCGFVLVSIYFWSGTQKWNLLFAHDIFPFLLHPLGDGFAERLKPFWFVAPAFESLVGVLLFIPRTRVLGLVGSCLMHGFLLFAVGPLGQDYNSTIWPWNFWMATMACILFVRNPSPLLRSAWAEHLGKAFVLLFGVMPAFNYVDRWDGFLSASFYSGRLRDGWIYVNADGAAHLAAAIKSNPKVFAEDVPGRFQLNITEWAAWDMNIPPYAEPRVYVGVVRKLEAAGLPPQDVELLVVDRLSPTSSERTYSEVPAPPAP